MDIRSIVVLNSLVVCALQVPASYAPAQNAKQRVPVTSAMVITALAAKHLPADGVTVRISAPITSASERPVLQVDMVTPLSPHTAQLRIVCSNRGDCLPFFAAVTWPDSVNVASLAADTGRGQKEPARRSLSASRDAEQPSFAMPAGMKAVLLIEDERVHVFIHVVALENGSAGDAIHVTTPDHKQRFIAFVVDAGLLKGHF